MPAKLLRIIELRKFCGEKRHYSPHFCGERTNRRRKNGRKWAFLLGIEGKRGAERTER